MPAHPAGQRGQVAGSASRNGGVFIHPYDNVDVICGQGTASLELLDEIGNLDAIITPVGGGGLSGTLTYSKGSMAV